MRWKTTPMARPYEYRSTVKFAFFPVRINETWVWLERYIQHQWFAKYGEYWIDDKHRRELL